MNREYISFPQVIGEIISYLIAVAATIYGVVLGLTIKGPVPTHYNYAGVPDGYGSAWTALIMPLTMLALNIILSYTVHFGNPKRWNMPFRINEEKAVLIYHDMVWMYTVVRLIFALLALMFTITVFKSGSALSVFSIATVVLLILSTIVFSIIAYMHNKA